MSITPLPPIYGESHVCSICTFETAIEDVDNLLHLECEKTEINQNCPGTYVHRFCLENWIRHNGINLRCLCCHTGKLKIDTDCIPIEVVRYTLIHSSLRNRLEMMWMNMMADQVNNNNNNTRNFMLLGGVCLVVIFYLMGTS